MTKKLILLLLTVTIGSTLFVSAQKSPKAVMTFKSTTKDFGTFKEEKGSVTHSFDFTNTGKQPVIIKKVHASCGCTTPSWSRQPIAPGQKGYIKVTYHAKNRPGPFNKSITVTANTVPAVSVLRIKGKVTPRVKTIADLYPRKMSGLRMKNNHISFTKVKNTEIKSVNLPVYNDSETPITIGFKHLPSHVSIKMVPATLKPKQKGTIVAKYDGAKKNDWGYVYDYLTLLINNEYKPGQQIVVSADIVEDFDKLTYAQKAKAPKIEVTENVFDFKQIKQGESVNHTFKIKNTGKSDLIIRKTKASCGCTAIAPQSKVIKPGKTTDLKVVFNSRGKRGRQNKSVTIITNDPLTPSIYLRITGNVSIPSIKK